MDWPFVFSAYDQLILREVNMPSFALEINAVRHRVALRPCCLARLQNALPTQQGRHISG
jgi:hypothetical protein